MVNVASVGFYIFFKFNKDLIFGSDLLTYPLYLEPVCAQCSSKKKNISCHFLICSAYYAYYDMVVKLLCFLFHPPHSHIIGLIICCPIGLKCLLSNNIKSLSGFVKVYFPIRSMKSNTKVVESFYSICSALDSNKLSKLAA